MILWELPSGRIELVFDGRELTVQFNTTCLEALPYCRAMCCRLRQYYNVSVDPDEVGRILTDRHGELAVVRTDPERDCCVYLTDANLCLVHEAKPRGCQAWHCSPGGIGEGVTTRGKGWVLVPAK